MRVLIVVAISFGHASLWARVEGGALGALAEARSGEPENNRSLCLGQISQAVCRRAASFGHQPCSLSGGHAGGFAKFLKIICKRCKRVAISNYNRAEQKAYWINLYNAATVDVIVARFPLKSIRDINISPGLLARGPWGAKLFSVEGERLSLDDIEHRILRPIWKDNRVHYALNCASLGCPNLQPEAFTADNTETLLERGALDFINHPRGVAIQKGRLQVSSIYVWFQEDFGGDAEGLMEHWQKYANPPARRCAGKIQRRLAHDYDWRLNGVETPK